MKKIKIYLDMDGTIADLYNRKTWLKDLRTEKKNTFSSLEPMISQERLLEIFPQDRYDIRILSMTPLGASKEYCAQVIKEKNEWLDVHFPLLTKRIYRRYGHNKNLKNCRDAILIDDNEKIRNSWHGVALNPMHLW